ncbi:hypothetical protein EYF80_062387 [Liparis tanakae]|uniref:Uncharacterized protein n=1 Tax=Liparis tanakae TaxID=230148 RepID=A0A4Z2EF10_9TELE|nr:hypothetical protein EYF80_062387 [Liparis tanakae]
MPPVSRDRRADPGDPGVSDEAFGLLTLDQIGCYANTPILSATAGSGVEEVWNQKAKKRILLREEALWKCNQRSALDEMHRVSGDNG